VLVKRCFTKANIYEWNNGEWKGTFVTKQEWSYQAKSIRLSGCCVAHLTNRSSQPCWYQDIDQVSYSERFSLQEHLDFYFVVVQWFSTFFGPRTIFLKKICDVPLCYADTSWKLVETLLAWHTVSTQMQLKNSSVNVLWRIYGILCGPRWELMVQSKRASSLAPLRRYSLHRLRNVYTQPIIRTTVTVSNKLGANTWNEIWRIRKQ